MRIRLALALRWLLVISTLAAACSAEEPVPLKLPPQTKDPPLEVTGIYPRSARAHDSVTLILSGRGLDGVREARVGGSQGKIVSQEVAQLRLELDFSGVPPGPLSIQLTDVRGRQVQLDNGFSIRVAQLGFSGPRVHPFVPMPIDVAKVAVGDLNADHLPDFVTVRSSTSPCVFAQLSVGDGSYRDVALELQPAVSCQNWVHILHIADLDADGQADLLVNDNQGTRAFYRTEALRFVAGKDALRAPAAAERVLGAEVADLNLDRQADVAILVDDGGGSSELLLARGEGSRVFAKPLRCPLSVLGRYRLVQGDWDGDGIRDLAAAGGQMPISLYAALARKSMWLECPAYSQRLASKFDSQAVASGLVNGDAWTDLLVGGHDGLFLVPGKTSGISTKAVQLLPSPIEVVEVGPLDSQGRRIILAGTGRSLSILHVDEGGDITERSDHRVSDTLHRLIAAPLSSDATFDIAAITARSLQVARAPLKESLSETLLLDASAPAASKDVTGDGIADLIFVDCVRSRQIKVLLGQRTPPYLSEPRTTDLAALGLFELTSGLVPDCTSAQLADFNGDGNADLALFFYADPSVITPGSLVLLRGTGDGTFQLALRRTVSRSLDARSSGLALADFNNDGKTDLALLTLPPADLRDRKELVQVSFSQAAREGTSWTLVDRFYPTWPRPVDLAAGMFGHHLPGLAIVNGSETSPLELLLSAGGDQMTPVRNIGSIPNGRTMLWQKLAVGDLNRDDQDDVVLLGDNGLLALIHGADHRFLPGCRGAGGNALAVRDLDLDGVPDIVSATEQSLSIFLSEGDGSCPLAISDPGWVGGSAILFADLNRDHLPDLLLGSGTLLWNLSH